VAVLVAARRAIPPRNRSPTDRTSLIEFPYLALRPHYCWSIADGADWAMPILLPRRNSSMIFVWIGFPSALAPAARLLALQDANRHRRPLPGTGRSDQANPKCPLWVKSRHLRRNKSCPLYPRKRTLGGLNGTSDLSKSGSVICGQSIDLARG
jgi:hypothetical protein